MQHYGMYSVKNATLMTVLFEQCNITDCTVKTVQYDGLYSVNNATLRTVLFEQCNITDCTM